MRRKKAVTFDLTRNDLIPLVFAFLSFLFIFRLYSIQIKKHGVLSAKAQEQYQNLSTIQAKRGNIYARDMQPLAASQKAYLMYFEPKVVSDKSTTSSKLAKLLAEDSSKKIFCKSISLNF